MTVSPASPIGLARWLALAALLLLLDQATKAWVVAHFQLHDSVALTPWFNLVRAHNTGAAFSFLAGAGGWQRWFFTVLGLGASAAIVWMLRRHPEQTLFCLAVTLVMGGALGNVVDRLLHGHVVDFIQLHWRGAYFPAFNVADSAITLGAVALVADELRRMRQARRTA
jgi:signal peptidase II